MNVFVPVPDSSLATKPKRKALLCTVIFIKEKCDNQVKIHDFTDERKQCYDFSCNKAASTTMTNKSVFLTGVVATMERCGIAAVDIMQAQTYMQSMTIFSRLYSKKIWHIYWILFHQPFTDNTS